MGHCDELDGRRERPSNTLLLPTVLQNLHRLISLPVVCHEDTVHVAPHHGNAVILLLDSLLHQMLLHLLWEALEQEQITSEAGGAGRFHAIRWHQKDCRVISHTDKKHLGDVYPVVGTIARGTAHVQPSHGSSNMEKRAKERRMGGAFRKGHRP